MKSKIVYKDKAGNTLIRTTFETKSNVQYSAKNKHGKLVTKKGVMSLMRKGGLMKK
jgi:hypothetical protein